MMRREIKMEFWKKDVYKRQPLHRIHGLSGRNIKLKYPDNAGRSLRSGCLLYTSETASRGNLVIKGGQGSGKTTRCV